MFYFAGSHSPQPPNPQKQIGPILENAIQRSPLLYIKVGKTQLAVNRYRYLTLLFKFFVFSCGPFLVK